MDKTKRKTVFRIIAFILPFAILFLIEISLRIFHYGDNLDLFIEARNNPDYLVLNPAASRRYFVNPAMAPTGNAELFRKNKDKNTLRIFVLGESTTIGYPYFHNGSFHRWLQYRLMRTFPDRQFEIINISLTAVNSYTVLGFAKELVHYEPDAVMIYSGHNEYYGTLGVGSTSKVGNNSGLIQLMLKLREFRLVQLFTRLYEKIKQSAVSKESGSGQTLMQRMVEDQKISSDSKLFFRGIDQFVTNMNEALGLLESHHIPVFLSNLVCNERDLKPFVSVEPDSIRFPGFIKNYNLGVKAYDNREWTPALQYFKVANQVYDGHALCNYYLGDLNYMQGEYVQAKKYFIQAKDLDGLRFRAPSQINEAILNLCKKYKNTHLVDAEAAFDSSSVNQITGSSLMLEHVHPNLDGYAILSEVFYRALKNENIFTPMQGNEMNFQALKEEMPMTIVDSLSGIYRVAKLKKSWPFNEVISTDSIKVETEEEKLAYAIAYEKTPWPLAMDQLFNFYLQKQDWKNAKTVMETMILEHPTDKYFYDQTASIYGKMGDFKNASFYFKHAFAISPSFDDARTLFVIYLKLDQPRQALPYLDYVIQNNASNINFLPVKKSTLEIIGLENEFSKDSSNLSILNLIATKYLSMGNKDGASIFVERVLKFDPKNKEAMILLEEIKKS